MNARLLPVLLLAAAVAGCAEPSRGSVTIPLGIPPAAQLVPAQDDLPGFRRVASADPGPDPHGGLGAAHSSFELAEPAPPSRAQLRFLAFVYQTNGSATEAFARFASDLPREARQAAWGDESILASHAGDDRAQEEALLRKGPVVWIAIRTLEHGPDGVPPMEELAALLLSKLDARA